MTSAQALELKKLTFLAWTNYLFSKGMITADKHRQMISEIQQLKK